ncbi:MAG: hypothetical protein C5B59_10125 [Bacteroidetes bacterium]|nr:MAG: hypothetical protein C5B59_10125 [Bacteroidota bacterium]
MRSISMRLSMILSFIAILHYSCSTTSSLTSVLGANPNLSGISSMMSAAGGVSNILGAKGPYTLLAPTNEALTALGGDAVHNMLQPENKSSLMSFLKNQVIAGNVTQEALKSGTVRNAAGNLVDLGSTVLGSPTKTKDGGLIFIVDKLLGKS